MKARRAERLGTGSDSKVLEERVERHLLEAEDRGAQQYVDIEQNTNRIVELEERLEFLERLLTKMGGPSDDEPPALLGG